MPMNLRYFLPVAMMAGLALSDAAQAIQIVQTDSFSITSNVGSVAFQEFDPALGTLDSISVSLTGTVSFNVTLQPGQLVTPRIDIDAIGAGGRGFDFALAGASLQFGPLVNSNPTAPDNFSASTTFSLSFILDALTDLTGTIVPGASAGAAAITPPATVEAQRSDFIAGIAPVGIFETLLFAPFGFSPSQIAGGGQMVLVYDYTPAEVTIPVAPAATLLLAGLGIAALLRRRRG